MTSTPTPALALGLALSFLTIPAPVQADQQLQLAQADAPAAAPRRDRPASVSAGRRPSRGEVAASQDFASECNLHGGGASTDPVGGETCTTPDGEDIIVPFP